MLKHHYLQRTKTQNGTNGRMRTRRQSRAAEMLEVRSLLSATTWPGLLNPQVESAANETLDAATDIGRVRVGSPGEFIGSIGESSDPSTDVDWLRFTLSAAGRVQITALPDANAELSSVVLTLYGDQIAEFDPGTPLGHRLLARQESAAGAVTPLDVNLRAGTYFVAVSGAGNRFFHPFLADSGLPGESGDYGLQIAVVPGLATGTQIAPPLEEGRQGNDTSSTAIDLGTFVGAAHLQVAGKIGDDPFYSIRSSNLFAQNLASDVDLYRFRIEGEGHFAFVAEAFAGRIGSALDPALTLFRLDAGGSLQQIAANNNTLNAAVATNGSIPLFADSVLFSGLTAGDYFVAVSSAGNDAEAGTAGVFNPHLAHSGFNGFSTGDYVLDLLVYADSEAPRVIATTPAAGTTFDRAPTALSIQFSETVNAQLLAYLESQETGDTTARPVFVRGVDGTRYFPRLQSFDAGSHIAQFLMLDALPNGAFELHVSGALGLTDLAGLPVAGNDPSGDFVTRFSVAGTPRGSAAGPTVWNNTPANDSLESAQDLGVIFPRELQSGVSLIRNSATNAGQSADTADSFRFELLQSRTIAFTLRDTGGAAGSTLQVLNEQGQPVRLLSLAKGTMRLGFLPMGKYVLQASGWDAANSSDVTYRIEVRLVGASENPTPLTSGAAPAVSIQLRGQGTPILVAPPSRAPDTQAIAAIPNGLLQGLNAPALGQPSSTSPGFTSNTALVRLFGFGDRDRLFTLIDAELRRGATTNEVTQAELTDAELRDILRRAPADTDESESESTEPNSESSTTPDSAVNTEKQPANNTNEDSPQAQPVSRTPVRRRVVKPTAVIESRSEEEPPAAFSAPIAFALAASLAHTLRDRARREQQFHEFASRS